MNQICPSFPLDAAAMEAATSNLIGHEQANELAETFKALGDPTRLRLVSALKGTELCVCDLAGILNMSQSAISHQLRVLRHLRLVRAHKRGRQVYYTLDDQHIEDLFERGLEHIQHR